MHVKIDGGGMGHNSKHPIRSKIGTTGKGRNKRRRKERKAAKRVDSPAQMAERIRAWKM